MPVALIPAGLQAAGGIFQTIFGGIKTHKALKALEGLQTPTTTANKGIQDYYNQALQRYNINPYQSQQYNYATQNAARTTAAGLNALQDRRSAIGGIGRLAAIQNNANLQAGIQAENQRNQNFNQLGSATQMKAADDQNVFNINKMMPYEKQLQLLGMKASGGTNLMNAGLSNIFGGLQNGSMIMSDKLLNQQQQTPFTPYPVDYSLAPIINNAPNTNYGSPPASLNRTTSLQMGYGMIGPKMFGG